MQGAFLAGMLDEALQSRMLGRKTFSLHFQRLHAVGAEVAVASPQTAESDQIPIRSTRINADGFDVALRRARTGRGFIHQAHHPLFGDAAQDSFDGQILGAVLRQIGALYNRDAAAEVVEHFLVRSAQDGFYFVKGVLVRSAGRGVGPLVNQLFSGQESHCFLARELHRRQSVALHDGVAHARFADERHARQFERPDVTVHRPKTDPEPLGNFLGADDALGLQLDQQGGQAVEAVHGFDMTFL